MKRTLTMASGLLLLISCGGSESTERPSAKNPTSTVLRVPTKQKPLKATIPPTTLAPVKAIGDKITTERGNSLTVRTFAPSVASTNSFSEPDPGKQFSAVEVEFCAGPAGLEGLGAPNPFDFELSMPDNTRVDPTLSVQEPALHVTDLQPGDCVRGWVTFEQPENVQPRFVVFTRPPLLKWAIG